MNREEFIKHAIASGKPKDEIRRIYDAIDAEGGFDDSTPPPAPAEVEYKPDLWEQTEVSVGKNLNAMQDNATRYSANIRAADQAKNPIAKQFKRSAATAQYVGQQAGRVLSTPVAAVAPALGALFAPVAKAAAPAAEKIGSMPLAQIVGNKLGKIGKWYGEQSPDTQENLRAFGTALEYLPVPAVKPVGAAVSKATGAAVRGTGEAVEKTGKGFLQGELKIKQNLAKKGYGKTIDDKKKIITDNIVKYDLHKTTGNFSKMADNASAKASERFAQADAIAQELSASDIRINPAEVMYEAAYKNLDAVPLGKKEQAEKIIDNILADMQQRGLDGDLTFDKMIEAKRLLDADGNLFKSGPAPSDVDALDRSIRKQMYLAIVDKAGELSPDIKRLNREGKELLDIEAVASDAASRTMNRDKISLTDKMIGVGTAVSAIGAAAAGTGYTPGALAIGAGSFGLKKLTEQGRGAAAIINAGKAIQKAGGKSGVPNASPVAVPQAATLPGNVVPFPSRPAISQAGGAAPDALGRVTIGALGGATLGAATAPEGKRGEYATIGAIAGGLGGAAAPKVVRAVGNQRGSVGGNPQTKTENFKKWFGDWEEGIDMRQKNIDEVRRIKEIEPNKFTGIPTSIDEIITGKSSAVIDENGNPLVVYHGGEKGIKEFDFDAPSRNPSSSGNNEYGAFFTNVKGEADWYARGGHYNMGKLKGKTYEVYLDIKNPYRTGDGNLANAPSKEKLMEKGYDGIIVSGRGDKKWYIPFSPNQIKSSTGNRGAFDPKNPDIRGSIGGTDVMAGIASLGAIGGAGYAATRKKDKK